MVYKNTHIPPDNPTQLHTSIKVLGFQWSGGNTEPLIVYYSHLAQQWMTGNHPVSIDGWCDLPKIPSKSEVTWMA